MLIDPSEIRVLGPLSAFATGFGGELTRLGYTRASADTQVRFLGHLSCWLESEALGFDKLCETAVERFLLARRCAGYKSLLSIKALRPILTYSRSLDVTPTASAPTVCTIKPVTLNRKNALFVCSDGGARCWAIVMTLIQTAKLNGINPQAWLTDVLERIVCGRTKSHELHTLLPWNWSAPDSAEPAVAA